jgi:hypothetical protein
MCNTCTVNYVYKTALSILNISFMKDSFQLASLIPKTER